MRKNEGKRREKIGKIKRRKIFEEMIKIEREGGWIEEIGYWREKVFNRNFKEEWEKRNIRDIEGVENEIGIELEREKKKGIRKKSKKEIDGKSKVNEKKRKVGIGNRIDKVNEDKGNGLRKGIIIKKEGKDEMGDVEKGKKRNKVRLKKGEGEEFGREKSIEKRKKLKKILVIMDWSKRRIEKKDEE